MTAIHSREVLTWYEPDPVPLRGTVVVLPGRGESPQVYERFGRRLASDAYRVHVVTAPTESSDAAGAQLHAVLEAADPGVARVVVGSDAGASYAAYLAARGALPALSALVLAGLPVAGAAAASTDWDAELDIRTSCPTHRARISQDGVQAGTLFNDVPAEWLDPAIPGLIEVATLGVHGAHDTLSPLDTARRWYAGIQRAELLSIAGGRHDVLNDQTHRSVAASIVLFLERLRAGADLAPIAVSLPLATEPAR